MTEQFELRRLSDDLVYTFTRQQRPDGLVGFKRSDQNLWIVYKPPLGWVAWDEESDAVHRETVECLTGGLADQHAARGRLGE